MYLAGYLNSETISARWALNVSTAPALEPVTVTEAKTHLHITGTDDDTKIGLLITAARQYLEKYLRRSLINQTFILSLDGAPSCSVLELPMPKLQSITHVRYYDTDDTLQTFSSASYRADTVSYVGRVMLKDGYSWPTVIADRADALQITYVSGYGAATTDVPEAIRQAVFMLVEHWYTNRGVVLVGTIQANLEFALENLLSIYKVTQL